MELTQYARLRENDAKLKRMTDLMKVMGHPSRLAIVDLLLEKERLTVGDITSSINISQSNTSQHLKALEGVGALGCEREGTFIYYFIKNPMLRMLIDCANKCTDC